MNRCELEQSIDKLKVKIKMEETYLERYTQKIELIKSSRVLTNLTYDEEQEISNLEKKVDNSNKTLKTFRGALDKKVKALDELKNEVKQKELEVIAEHEWNNIYHIHEIGHILKKHISSLLKELNAVQTKKISNDRFYTELNWRIGTIPAKDREESLKLMRDKIDFVDMNELKVLTEIYRFVKSRECGVRWQEEEQDIQ